MPNNIDAAFRSSKTNECYIFVKDKYVVLNYAPGGKKREIITGPRKIADGFPMFKDKIFENRIDCAFETTNNEAYIFSGNQCAKTTAPQSTNARLLLGPIPITAMFPCVIGTVFENGIEASIRSSYIDTDVYLFKGDEFGKLDITSIEFKSTGKISWGFPLLTGTVFESGIDAAFNSHGKEWYIFKGQYYARYENGKFLDGRIKRIHDDWPALHSMI